MHPVVPPALGLAIALAGCGSDSVTPPTVDGGRDAGARRDAGRDAGDGGPTDGGPGPGTDAGQPAPRDLHFMDSEHWVGPPLPACTSDLMRAIHDRAVVEVGLGSVPPRWFLTWRNRSTSMVRLEGPEIFPAMFDLIAEARHEVAFQTYVWEQDSQPAQEVLDAIVRLEENRLADPTRGAPVRVRFLFDASDVGFGSPPIEESMPLLASALEAMDLDPTAVTWEIGAFRHAALGNLHVKTVVVDGLHALLTGANPQHHHDYERPWHDAGFEVSGEVAVGMLADFEHAWMQSHEWTCGSTAGDPATCTRTPGRVAHRILEDPGLADACMPMLIAMRLPDASPLSNRTDNTQDQAFLAAFEGAAVHIHMETPNLNDDAAKGALLDAVRRGVIVDIVLSKGFNDDTESLPGQGGTNERNVDELYATLMGEGMADACDRLRIRWYSWDGRRPIEGNIVRANHTKYASVDDQVVLVGSANMDTQSWNNSREVNVIVDDADTARVWDTQLFLADFERGIIPDPCL